MVQNGGIPDQKVASGMVLACCSRQSGRVTVAPLCGGSASPPIFANVPQPR